MNDFIFVKATEGEKNEVLCLYHSVIGTQFCTWNENYPTETEIEWDMKTSNLFLLKSENTLIGAVSIVPENELEEFDFWEFRNASEIARVAIAPSFQGYGFAVLAVESIERELQKRGVSAVHLLVAKKNIPAYQTYLKCGYKIKGEVFMYGNDYFACEKELLK